MIIINDPVAAQVLLQMCVLLFTAKCLGAVCRKIHCPEVVGEFLSGIIWGPSLVQWAFPGLYNIVFPKLLNSVDTTVMDLVTLLGFLTMLALSGSEITVIPKQIRGVIAGNILICLCTSFIGGFGLLYFIPNTLLKSDASLLHVGFFLTICLCMSAVPIISRVLNDWGIVETSNGQFLILSSSIVDILGWILLSIGIVMITSDFSYTSSVSLVALIFRMIIGLFLLVAIGYLIIRIMDRLGLDVFIWPLFLGFGVYTYFGAKINPYIGGLVFGIVASTIPRYKRLLHNGLKGFANEVFAPLFFAMVGHHGNMLIFSDPKIVVFTIIILIVGVAIKTIPTLFAKPKNTTWREFWMISLCLNARGGMEIFVVVTGTSLGLFNNSMYTVLVTIAILTAISCPIVLNWYMTNPAEEDRNIVKGKLAS